MIKNIKDSIEDKTNDDNNKNKNKIDYEEKLKEVDELKNKVNELTNNFTSLQKTLEEFIKTNSQTKSNEKTHIIDEDGEKIRKYTKTRSKFDRKTGQMVVYAEELNKDDNESEANQKRSNYSFNLENIQDIDEGNCRSSRSQLGIIDKQSGTGSFLGSAIGSLFAGTGGLTLGMKMSSKFDSTNRNQNVNGITKEFLILNSIQNYNEFVERAKIIDPTTSEETIEYILNILNYDKNDINNLNQFILDLYDKAMERKIESEKEIDYSNYKCKNLLGEYMEKNGKKVAWLSKRTGVPRSTLESICRNPDLMPTVDKALKICRVLGEDLETIFPLQEQ